jgi:hypothetical protein
VLKTTPVSITPEQRLQLKDAGRKCWEALHGMTEPSTEKIAEWIKTVPSFGCGCQKFAREYIETNPPPCDDPADFFHWTWRFHTTVDGKTNDTPMTFDEAVEFWSLRLH